MKNYTHNYKHFYGVEITPEEIKNGYINYRTLAKTFDAVLCNDITKLFYADINGEYTEPEQVNGYIDNSEEIEELKEQLDEIEEEQIEIIKTVDDHENNKNYIELQKRCEAIEEQIEELEREQDEQPEIYQYFIIDNNGVDILSSCTDEIIYHLPTLDMYIWGVTHFGTPWNGVNTDIKIKLDGEC